MPLIVELNTLTGLACDHSWLMLCTIFITVLNSGICHDSKPFQNLAARFGFATGKSEHALSCESSVVTSACDQRIKLFQSAVRSCCSLFSFLLLDYSIELLDNLPRLIFSSNLLGLQPSGGRTSVLSQPHVVSSNRPE